MVAKHACICVQYLRCRNWRKNSCKFNKKNAKKPCKTVFKSIRNNYLLMTVKYIANLILQQIYNDTDQCLITILKQYKIKGT